MSPLKLTERALSFNFKGEILINIQFFAKNLGKYWRYSLPLVPCCQILLVHSQQRANSKHDCNFMARRATTLKRNFMWKQVRCYQLSVYLMINHQMTAYKHSYSKKAANSLDHQRCNLSPRQNAIFTNLAIFKLHLISCGCSLLLCS